MHIGLDFGGVIANHLPEKIALTRELFGVAVDQPSQVTRAALEPQLGSEKYAELVFQVGGKTLDFPLFPHVQSVLKELVAQGDTLSVVTTQTNANEESIQRYFEIHALPIQNIAVVNADVGKLQACQQLGVEFFVDDSLSVLESLRPLGIPRVLAAFASDYVVEKIDPQIILMRDWKDFMSIYAKS